MAVRHGNLASDFNSIFYFTAAIVAPQQGMASALPHAAFDTFLLGLDSLAPLYLALMQERRQTLVWMLLY